MECPAESEVSVKIHVCNSQTILFDSCGHWILDPNKNCASNLFLTSIKVLSVCQSLSQVVVFIRTATHLLAVLLIAFESRDGTYRFGVSGEGGKDCEKLNQSQTYLFKHCFIEELITKK